ncbi:MAG: DUF1611 domain-containing protein [Pseudomonadota bacterium]
MIHDGLGLFPTIASYNEVPVMSSSSSNSASEAPAIRKPYLLFLGDCDDPTFAKTALGIVQWAPEDAVGVLTFDGFNLDIGVPSMGVQEAVDRGAGSLLIGVSAIGGQLLDSWIPVLVEALHAGLDIVSGLHSRLSDNPAIAEAARATGRQLHDVRYPRQQFPIANGRKRTGKRILTVGTDCALGKKYTALALTKAMTDAGLRATFRATGQTGILIAGSGIPIDAVVSDFVAGAAETLSPDNDPDHWDVIEGQGSLFHPAYAAVSLGLLHGSQPDAMVLCHEPNRPHINAYPDYKIPSLTEAMRRFEDAARLTNPQSRVVAVSLNTSKLNDQDAEAAAKSAEDELGLPVMDALRFGSRGVVDKLISDFS